MIKAFISHSSKQKEFAQELYKKVGGDFCYIDCYDFQPAFKTIDEIYAKIDSCTIFVLLIHVFSPDKCPGTFLHNKNMDGQVKI